MSRADRERWEKKYAKPRDPHRSSAVTASVGRLAPVNGAPSPPWALDLACGAGRNAAALAALGYRVVAADVAFGALAPQSATAGIHPVQIDVDEWPFGASCFDLVVQCDFLDRSRIANAMDAVRPGGLFLLDTFMQPQRGGEATGPSNPDFRLEPGELADRFGAWEILELLETDEPGSPCRASVLAAKR